MIAWTKRTASRFGSRPSRTARPSTTNLLHAELSEIKQTVDEEREAAAENSFHALLPNGTQRFRYRPLLGIDGQFMQQLSIELSMTRHTMPIENVM